MLAGVKNIVDPARFRANQLQLPVYQGSRFKKLELLSGGSRSDVSKVNAELSNAYENRF